MIKKKYYFYLVTGFIAVYAAAVFATDEQNIVYTSAQIESNSTFTTCINGKCVTTTTTCIINQPCHTVRSNSTNTDNNNNNNNSTDDNNVITMPFSQGTI
jgi:hypothetical protein